MDWDGAFPRAMTIIDPGWDGVFPLGSHIPLIPVVPVNWRAEILVDSEVIWSAVNALPQQDLILDVFRFTGMKTLTFRIVGIP